MFKLICQESTKDKIIVFSEKRSKLIVKNDSQKDVLKVTVDGCEITSGIRCDYLMIVNEKEYFIELKGQDVNHAIEQIEETIKSLSSDAKNSEKVSFIICTRSPLASTSIQNFQVKFRKKFRCKLIIKNSPHTVTI
tara:strand:- start:188 stop:595 length:408 start_codon:yes stop_codon:yes gene_type:complete